MDRTYPTDDAGNDASHLEKQLDVLNSLTRTELSLAERLLDAKLQATLDSLEKSARSIRMLLAAQTPAELATSAGMAQRTELENLLANSVHLSRLAGMMKDGFASGREACERRTERQMANVVDAVDRHRTAVQDNAIALTQAALDRARAPSPLSHASRAAERRPR